MFFVDKVAKINSPDRKASIPLNKVFLCLKHQVWQPLPLESLTLLKLQGRILKPLKYIEQICSGFMYILVGL